MATILLLCDWLGSLPSMVPKWSMDPKKKVRGADAVVAIILWCTKAKKGIPQIDLRFSSFF